MFDRGGVNKSRENSVIRLQIPCAGERLDQAISDNCSSMSRTLTKKIIDIGGVHLNGRRVRQCGLKVAVGDKVEIFIDGFSLKYFRITEDAVLYQDKYIIAINKPSLIESQPTPARYKGTIYEALLLWLQDPFRPQLKPSLGMVQRLDRDTSGVMVFSVHPHSHKSLTDIFTTRQVRKSYLALISGCPDKKMGEFESLLAKNRATNKIKSVSKGGKLATTKYKIINQFDDCALVEVHIPTGRTHQIRVHFAEAGHPLVGDTKYGYHETMLKFPVQRTMLHSWQLEFLHPVTKKNIQLVAPVAHDMYQVLLFLGWDNDNISTN